MYVDCHSRSRGQTVIVNLTELITLLSDLRVLFSVSASYLSSVSQRLIIPKNTVYESFKLPTYATIYHMKHLYLFILYKTPVTKAYM